MPSLYGVNSDDRGHPGRLLIALGYDGGQPLLEATVYLMLFQHVTDVSQSVFH